VLAFYQTGGFRTEAQQCLTLLGRARRNKGDYDGARLLFEQKLQLSQQANDQSQLATAHEGLGNVLKYQENYPEALRHFEEKYAITKTLGKQSSIAYSLLSLAETRFQLGRYPEAYDAINQADSIAKGIKGGDKRLSAEVYLLKARTALTERKFSDAMVDCQRAREFSGKESEEVLAWVQYLVGLAQAFSGHARTGQQTGKEALAISTRLNNSWLVSAATLVLAQSQVESGDPGDALENAIKAQDVFTRSGQKDSEWRALLIAARASQQLGDKDKARIYARQSDQALSELKSKWQTEDFNRYFARPDVHFLQGQLRKLIAETQ
jgi:tetratricopeptide (TPR) repeat protein